MFYIDPYRENPLRIFLSETRRPRSLIFGMSLHLIDHYQSCSNYSPGFKNWPRPRGHMFYIDPYREKPLKIFLSDTRRPRSLLFGSFVFAIWQLCLVDLY